MGFAVTAASPSKGQQGFEWCRGEGGFRDWPMH
jgi:hypothetical protein